MRHVLLGLLLAMPLAGNAAVTFGTGGSGNSAADGGPLTLTLPAHSTGELLSCVTFQKSQSGGAVVSETASTGWTQVYGYGSTDRALLWQKVATSGSETNPTFDSDDNTGGHTVVGGCWTGAGFLADLGTIVAHSAETSAIGTNVTTPALTVTTDNTMVVACGFHQDDWETADVPALSGFTEILQFERTSSAVAAFVCDYVIQTTAANISASEFVDDGGSGSIQGYAFTVSLKPAVAAPTWSVSPTVSAQDTDSYTLSYTPSTSCTFKAAVCKKDTDPPDEATVIAGNCDESYPGAADGPVAALATASEAVTGADTTETGALSVPIGDIYVTCDGAGGDAALVTLADEMLDAPTGYQYDLLASVSATSPCKDLNDIPISPTIAADDVTKWSTATSPSGYAFAAGVDCDTQYTDPAGTRQTAALDVYDTSAGDWMSGGPTTTYYNNTVPTCTLSNCEYNTGIGLINGVAMDSVAMSNWFSDADTGDSLVITYSGDLPTGTSVDGSGNWTVTPSCASGDTAGAFTATATDEAGDTETVAVTWLCLDQVVVPDCVGESLSACVSLLETAGLGVDFSSTPSVSVPALEVISQDPAASTEVDPASTVALVVSSGVPAQIRLHNGMYLGLKLGL